MFIMSVSILLISSVKLFALPISTFVRASFNSPPVGIPPKMLFLATLYWSSIAALPPDHMGLVAMLKFPSVKSVN
uniref:Uncharacterized protein n=1 Tax=uncultured marine virus TaxID=186617 RepID=A0A0F7L4T8_9VIRU|nr:hypothetical protein [uncultured marine virus]